MINLWLIVFPVLVHGSLDFETAVSKIVERSPEFAKVQAGSEATIIRNRQSRLVFLPTVDAVVSHSKSKTYSQSEESYSRSQALRANLNLFRSGADYAGFRAAGFDNDSQESRILHARLVEEFKAVNLLSDFIQLSQEVEIGERLFKVVQESLDIAQKRYEKGLLPLQEVNKVKMDFENAGAQLTDTRIEFETKKANIESYLETTNIEMSWPWKRKIQELKLNQKFDIENLPAWRAAVAQSDSISSKRDSGYLKMLPSLDASFETGHYTTPSSNGPGWGATLTLTLPLFDRLTNLSEAQAQSKLFMAAEIEKEHLRKSAVRDFELYKTSLAQNLASALRRDSNLKLSQQLYQDNMIRFKSGRASANDVAQDMKRLSEAERLASLGWKTVHLQFVKYCQSQGLSISSCLN